MNGHSFSLLSTPNRLWTISFLITALLLIAVALIMGMRNNLPMNFLFFCGISLLYLALTHSWKKSINYFYLLGTTLFLFLMMFLITFIVSNLNIGAALPNQEKINIIAGAIFTIIGLCICVPGMIIGLLGTLILGQREHPVIKEQ